MARITPGQLTEEQGMTDKAKPFTREELTELVNDAAYADAHPYDLGMDDHRALTHVPRFMATLRELSVEYDKLENAMNEVSIWSRDVEAERDRYKAVAGAYMGEWDTPRAKAENIRYWIRVLDMANEAEEVARALAWEALADHLEALPTWQP